MHILKNWLFYFVRRVRVGSLGSLRTKAKEFTCWQRVGDSCLVMVMSEVHMLLLELLDAPIKFWRITEL